MPNSASHPQHRVIFAEYQALRDASELSRYGTINQFLQAFPGDQVQAVLIAQYLATIENQGLNVFDPPANASTSSGS